jgi:hypothetical protein
MGCRGPIHVVHVWGSNWAGSPTGRAARQAPPVFLGISWESNASDSQDDGLWQRQGMPAELPKCYQGSLSGLAPPDS